MEDDPLYTVQYLSTCAVMYMPVHRYKVGM